MKKMSIIVENVNVGKLKEIDVTELELESPEDLTIIINYERFKLVSTKTEKELHKEKLINTIRECGFAAIYEKHADEDIEDVKKKSVDWLNDYITNDSDLKELTYEDDYQTLVCSLAIAYSTVHEAISERKKINLYLEQTMEDNNILIDYAKRLQTIFKNSKTLKELDEGLIMLDVLKKYDPHPLIHDYKIVENCMDAYLKWSISEMDELKSHNRGSIADQSYYNIRTYYKHNLTGTRNAVLKRLKDVINRMESARDKIFNMEESLEKEHARAIQLCELFDRVVELTSNEDNNSPTDIIQSITNFKHKLVELYTLIDLHAFEYTVKRSYLTDNQHLFYTVHLEYVKTMLKTIVDSVVDSPTGCHMGITGIRHHVERIGRLIDNTVTVEELLEEFSKE